MFEAQILKVGCTVYSPWFPRGGCSITATLEVVEIDGTDPTINVEVYTKASDDSGAGTDAEAGRDITRTLGDGPGRTSETWVGKVNDFVRYKFTIANESSEDPGWVLFRMLPPQWFDAVIA